MSGYSIISDVGNGIVKLLRSQLVPEIILNSDAVGLCSPDDRGDMVLGVHLYDVKESEEVAGRTPRMRPEGENSQRYPSLFLTLFYMITAYSPSDVKFRASEEQRILGKTMQTLFDFPVLGSEWIGEEGGAAEFPVRVEMLRIDNEEKMKLWNMPNLPYKLSLYYKVYPVEIESQRVREVRRVVDADLTVSERR
ncbi:DUF4255 domain-containing protein [Bacilliculturomica massiliensis]|uniref:DUF4255 domain-containing protein n=1 Tax=Bacilliculturomica massiliensis TaxID=1917867 RepID=UPI0010316632|nr:DUF4255 domain-containing protein [Bacilliculturomica massiliensis]